MAGQTCLLGYLAATIGTWCGVYWLSFGERPENFILAGTVMAAASLLPWHRQNGFAGTYRLYGALTVLTPPC
ncbi:hypothetical protein [Geobacter sp.]|uniref:hypothetical protein n=1 Tax=Geobacter sp. TaxID=46610 RepID=UPI00262D7843|nr:hypothetical protein [Geobacter sp.]